MASDCASSRPPVNGNVVLPIRAGEARSCTFCIPSRRPSLAAEPVRGICELHAGAVEPASGALFFGRRTRRAGEPPN
jgi:hypothetical protein